MIVGTAHFKSKEAAIRYYATYTPGESRADTARKVNRKIEEGEIHIGPPDKAKYPGMVKMEINREGRYEVTISDR